MLKFKKCSLYNQDILFKENSIEVKYKKELKQHFQYSDILQFDIFVNVDKFYSPNGFITNWLCDYPCIYSVNLTIDIKTEKFDKYTYMFICPLKQIFELIKYRDKIKKFNLYLIEEDKIKNFVKIPLIFYAISGVKFNLLGNPFSIIELFSFLCTFIPLLIMFLPAYLSNTLDIGSGFIILPFFIVSLCLSIIGINNERKKLKLKHEFVPDMIVPNIEKINKFGETQDLIIDNNKIIFSKECYQYLQRYRYTSLLLFILNLTIILNILRIINII